MGIVYKKEMTVCRYNILSYLLIAGLVLFVGVYTMALNLSNGLPNFEYALNNARIILLIFIPVLTMGTLAGERANKTDQLLYGGAVGMGRIISGKFLAVLTVFMVPVFLFLFYPLLLSRFGAVNFVSAYVGILGLVCLGATLIAAGIFVSSLTDSPSVAAIASFCLLMLFYMMPTLVGYVSSTPLTSLIGYLAVAAAVSAAVYMVSRSLLRSFLIFCLCGAVPGLLFSEYPELLRGSFKEFLEFFAVFSPFELFIHSIVRLRYFVYYPSLAALFLFGARLSMSVGREPAARRLVSALCAVLAVGLLNFAAGLIPPRFSDLDVSAARLYTLSDQSRSVLSALDEDVTMYLLLDGTDRNLTIHELLKRYDSAGEHSRLVEVNMAAEPRFLAPYTSEKITSNSVIVESAKRFVIVPYEEIFLYDYSDFQSTGQYSLSFNGEQMLTQAVEFVVTDHLPVLYVLEGHGEAPLPPELRKMVGAENIRQTPLNLRLAGAVPEDAACIMLTAPLSDISEAEARALLAYLEGGGEMLLLTSPSDAEFPNLDGVMRSYGLERVNEIILETDAAHYVGSGNRILPGLVSHAVTDPLTNRRQRVLLPNAHGIRTVDSGRYLLDRYGLLTSSASAVTDRTGASGPFALGVAVTDQLQYGRTNIVWLAGGGLTDEETNELVSGANYNLFLNCLDWLCERTSRISIRPRGFNTERLVVPTAQVYNISAALIVALPMALMAIGVFMSIYRTRNH